MFGLMSGLTLSFSFRVDVHSIKLYHSQRNSANTSKHNIKMLCQHSCQGRGHTGYFCPSSENTNEKYFPLKSANRKAEPELLIYTEHSWFMSEIWYSKDNIFHQNAITTILEMEWFATIHCKFTFWGCSKVLMDK